MLKLATSRVSTRTIGATGFLLALLLFALVHFEAISPQYWRHSICGGDYSVHPTHLSGAGLHPVSDAKNAFADFRHCGINSLNLYQPAGNLCTSRHDTLQAMSWGGRAGFDMPYIPFGCGFQWYSLQETCSILSRFSHVYIVGDSLQRMLFQAIFILLRQDLGLGGVARWELKRRQPEPGQTTDLADCLCEDQLKRHECSDSYPRSISDLMLEAGEKTCRSDSAGAVPDLSYHKLSGYPSSNAERQGLLASLADDADPTKPVAFVMHHTFWSNVNITATLGWIDDILDLQTGTDSSVMSFQNLFVTANNPGSLEDQVVFEGRTSNNVAKFERAIAPNLESRNVDMLGFYNMSVQASANDNIHASLRTNLLKAMMVINWLDWSGKT